MFNDGARRKRIKDKRERRVKSVGNTFTALLSMNQVFADIPGNLDKTADIEAELSSSADALTDVSNIHLPVANAIGPALVGGLAIGSFYMLKKIIEETKNV